VIVVDRDACPGVLSLCFSGVLLLSRKKWCCNTNGGRAEDELERNGGLSPIGSPASLVQFGLTIRPFVTSKAVTNGHRPHEIPIRRLMFSLFIKPLVAGSDLIELRRSEADHSVRTVSISNI
jgi:hypothetical protein